MKHQTCASMVTKSQHQRSKMDASTRWVHQLVSEPYDLPQTSFLKTTSSDHPWYGRSSSSEVGQWMQLPNPSPQPPNEGTTGVAASPSPSYKISSQNPFPNPKIRNQFPNPISKTNLQNPFQNQEQPNQFPDLQFRNQRNPFPEPQNLFRNHFQRNFEPRQTFKTQKNDVNHFHVEAVENSDQSPHHHHQHLINRHDPINLTHQRGRGCPQVSHHRAQVEMKRQSPQLPREGTTKSDLKSHESIRSEAKVHNQLQGTQWRGISSEDSMIIEPNKQQPQNTQYEAEYGRQQITKMDEVRLKLHHLKEASFDRYFDVFVKLVFPIERLVTSYNEGFIQELLLKLFVEGLQEETKRYVLQSTPSNLLNVMNLAIFYEDVMKYKEALEGDKNANVELEVLEQLAVDKDMKKLEEDTIDTLQPTPKAKSACTNTVELMQDCGYLVLQPYIPQLAELTLTLLRENSACQQLDSDSDEGDVDHDEMLMDAISDLLPAFAQAMGSHFEPILARLFDPLMKFVKALRPPQDQTMVVACLAEVAQQMGAPISAYVDKVRPLELKELASPEATNRRNDAFCAGEICKNGGAVALKYYGDILRALYPLFGESEPDFAVSDNVAGVVTRMIMILTLVPDLVRTLAQVVLSLAESDEEKTQIAMAFSHLISKRPPRKPPNTFYVIKVFVAPRPSTRPPPKSLYPIAITNPIRSQETGSMLRGNASNSWWAQLYIRTNPNHWRQTTQGKKLWSKSEGSVIITSHKGQQLSRSSRLSSSRSRRPRIFPISLTTTRRKRTQALMSKKITFEEEIQTEVKEKSSLPFLVRSISGRDRLEGGWFDGHIATIVTENEHWSQADGLISSAAVQGDLQSQALE